MEYKQIDKLNQSSLKKILISPQDYLREINRKDSGKTPDHFLFGTLVDFLLTEKEKEFEDYFYKMKDVKISENIKIIVDKLFQYYSQLEEFDKSEVIPITAKDLIVKYAKEIEYGQSYKEDTLLNKVFEQGKEYYSKLQQSKGKTIITEEDYNKAVMCKMAVMSNPKLAKYFKKTANTTIVFKPVIEFTYMDQECKLEIDVIHIDHELKLITVIDIKTTSYSELKFKDSFWKFRYDFQGSFYITGVKHAKQFEKYKDQGYKLNTFKFLVIEKDLLNKPVIWNMSKNIYTVGMNGGILNDWSHVEGVNDAFRRLKWHQENDLWEFPLEYYENNEEFELTL